MTDATPQTWTHSFTLDRRQFLLAALGGAGALALAGCAGSAGRPSGGPGGRPTVRTAEAVTGFPSPFASNADFGYNQASLLYDTLLWNEDSGKPIPWLAKSYTSSPDHLTYTFELRDGVKWSDGRPFTADDVVFTYEYYKKQGQLLPPVIIQPPKGIAKVVATDPNTVVFTLEQPNITFPNWIAAAVPIVPRHIWESVKDPGTVLDPKILVGTGPYTLTSYNDDGQPGEFTAKDDYFLGAPYVKKIQLNALTDQFAALLSGQTDIAEGFGVRDDVLARFKASGEYGTITNIGDFVINQLYFNLGRPVLSDARFRQACAMAIDRKELVTRVSAGHGAPGNPGFLSPQSRWYNPNVRQYELDVAGANALLDSAGYRMGPSGIRQGPDGKPLSFEFRFDSIDAVPMSEIVIPAIKRIGVELKPKPSTLGPELFGPKLFGGYDMAVLLYPGPSPGGPNADPEIMKVMFRTVPGQFSLTSATSYDNPAFNTLADKQSATFDEAERKKIVAQMQKIIADDLPVLPLYYPERTQVFRKKVLDQWYFTPGQFPTSTNNKALFVTGQKTGTEIRQPES